jgi:YidC/Oxa1 family membrane protein insertase
MFLQLPIFIGLYRCLSVDIELRQAPLIPGISWCSNLAGPDMAWRWQESLPDFLTFLTSETGWLGPYLNVLPIITIVLFIWQQKMFTPPATDEQTRMQQKMMQYMMIFMGILFFKVPAGLCVYFVASSLWGIGERKILPPPGSNAATPSSPAPPQGDPKKQSLLDRLMNKPPAESVDDIRARRKSRR